MFRQMNHLKKHFEQTRRIVQKNYPSSNQYESLYLAIVRKYFPFQKVESEMNIFHQNYRRFHPVSHGASAAPETGAREECLDQPMPTQPSPQGGTVKSWKRVEFILMSVFLQVATTTMLPFLEQVPQVGCLRNLFPRQLKHKFSGNGGDSVDRYV